MLRILALSAVLLSTVPAMAGDYDALLAAVKAQDVTTVTTLLDQGVSPNPIVPPDPAVAAGKQRPLPFNPSYIIDTWPEQYYPETPLHLASACGSLPIVRLLLDHGARLEAQDRLAWTPLCDAVCARHEEVVLCLLEHGASATPRCPFYDSPLSHALRRDMTQVAIALMDHGAVPDEGMLAAAMMRKKTDLVLPLLRHRAKWDRSYGKLGPMLVIAASFGLNDAVEYLLDNGMSPEVTDQYGATALVAACGRKYLDVARTLLEHGADPNMRTNSGATPLSCACECPDPALARLLLGHGAKWTINAAAMLGDMPQLRELLDEGEHVDTLGAWDKTPLMLALEHGQSNAATLLIAKGANVNARDHNSITPLHYAAGGPDPEMVSFLIAAGAEVNARAKDTGATPLHYAARSGRADSVRRLLDAGALIAPGGDFSDLLYWAARAGNLEVGILLLEHGAKATTADLCGASLANATELVKVLLEKGARPTRPTEESQWGSALHYAAANGNVELSKLLLSHGANAEEVTTAYPPYDPSDKGSFPSGTTPLYWAVYRKHPEMVSFLLSSGVKPNVVAGVGSDLLAGQVTPLHLAAEVGDLTIVKLLTDAGSQVDAKDTKGQTPIDYAKKYRSADVAAYLTARAAE